jgi:phosphatidylserine decarboxylase
MNMALSEFENARIYNGLPVAREGLPFIFIGTGLTFLFLLMGVLFLTIFMGILSLFTIYFFRDPRRENTFPEKTVLTPADGRILDIRNLQDRGNPLGEPAIKLSIFMSIYFQRPCESGPHRRKNFKNNLSCRQIFFCQPG